MHSQEIFYTDYKHSLAEVNRFLCDEYIDYIFKHTTLSHAPNITLEGKLWA